MAKKKTENAEYVAPDSLLDLIRPGMKVTISVPGGLGRHGREYVRRTGRAVMRGPAGWVLNMGGPHGTPGIAQADNIVKIHRGKAQA